MTEARSEARATTERKYAILLNTKSEYKQKVRSAVLIGAHIGFKSVQSAVYL